MDPLIQSLQDLSSNSTVIYLALEERDPGVDADFMEKLALYFNVRRVGVVISSS
mgnify:CR=1 FL=1